MSEEILTERMKGLLTLIVDKVNRHGYMMGAHHNKNWATQQYYKLSGGEQMQGTLDRIGKVSYHLSRHHDENSKDWFPPPHPDPSFHDHTMRFHWREPFGKGCDTTPKYTEGMLLDKKGRWHYPCDDGVWISLYHPSKQGGGFGCGNERVGGCWMHSHPYPYWRPEYHYTTEEVIAALKIMAAEFNWEFEIGGDMQTMILYGETEEAEEPKAT